MKLHTKDFKSREDLDKQVKYLKDMGEKVEINGSKEDLQRLHMKEDSVIFGVKPTEKGKLKREVIKRNKTK